MLRLWASERKAEASGTDELDFVLRELGLELQAD